MRSIVLCTAQKDIDDNIQSENTQERLIVETDYIYNLSKTEALNSIDTTL